MRDPIHHLRVLHNNPFIFAPALAAFFEELGVKKRSFLLGYLVLPMTLHFPSRRFLQHANSRSSLRTMLQERARIHGLEERLARYREMTNTTFQYLLDGGVVSVDGQLSVLVYNVNATAGPSPDGVVRAARQLGRLLHPYDVSMVFRMLGVVAL